MERVRSFGRSRSLGSGMKRLPFTSAPEPPGFTQDDDGFYWSTEVSKQRASPPRLLAPSRKDTDRLSSPTLLIGAEKTPPASPPRNRKKPGRTKRTLNALALLDGSTKPKHGGRSSTPDAPGYGGAVAAPNIAQYRADQSAGKSEGGGGKPMRTLEIPTAGPLKRTADRSVLTDEMSNLHEHRLSKQRMAEMQADDDVSALSMGTAGREFYGWDAEANAKSGAFGLGKKKGPSRTKKKYGQSGRSAKKNLGTSSPVAMLGAISENIELAPQEPATVDELKAWTSAVESTPPITKRKKTAAANKSGSDTDLVSPSAAASSRSMSPRYKKTGRSNSGATSPTRSSPRAHASPHSSGETGTENAVDKGGIPTADVLADLVTGSKTSKSKTVGRRSPVSKGGEIHDDVTMVRTNSQGHHARATPPRVNRYSQAVGSFDQSTDVATEQKQKTQKSAKSPLYVIASYDSNDNSLLQSRLSFPPAHPRPSSGDEYIDAYQHAVRKYNSKLMPVSPARSTKSSATAETAALSRASTPANSPARPAGKPPSISTGSSSTGDKKSKSSSPTGAGLKNLVRIPSFRKARSFGKSTSFKAMFSTTKAAEDTPEITNQMPQNKPSDGIDTLGVGQVREDELSKRQGSINRQRSSFTNEDNFERNDSYDSLEDDDYTEDFNVVKEIMEKNAGNSRRMRANTYGSSCTGGTAPSMTNDVGDAIADLFCFNPLSAFDLDNICHPTPVKATAGNEPQTPMSNTTASFFALSNDQAKQVPAMPAYRMYGD